MPLEISDETLRDGEQQAQIVFSSHEKRDLARRSAALGVQYINTIPICSEEESMLVEGLVAEGLPITTATLLGKKYVDHAVGLGVKEITLFTSVSDILLGAKGKEPQENLDEAKRVVQYAKGKDCVVDFALEDASRTDIGYLKEFAQMLKPHIRYLVLCDTVGCLQPNLAELFVKAMKKEEVKLGIHCHNDLGLAVENTVRAVLAGAELISGTFTGIGERAGNASLEQVLTQLKKEGSQWEVPGFDYDKMEEMSRMVIGYARRGPALPMSPEAFYTETGIHVHAMRQDREGQRKAYSIFPKNHSTIWFGKYSGMSNFAWLFERTLGDPQPEERYAEMRDAIKARCIAEKKSFSTPEVIEMYKRGEI